MDFRNIVEFLKDAFKYIIVIVIVLLLFIFVVGIEQVVGPSMEPTLKQGNVIIVNKLTYRLHEIQRNDVVIITKEDKHMVKRIVGLPGEKVEYKDNYVYVDGKKYKEKFIDGVNTDDFSISDLGYDVIPDDMYLVLGDNREDSRDSRSFGLVEKENIIGKVWIRIFPFNKINFVK